jgi:glycosyltransferase involved in cell wall biosynthesis
MLEDGEHPPSICFVAPNAWPILSADPNIRIVGGAEVQQTLLARALAKRGYRISMVCMNFGQPDGIVVDGITVYRMHAPDAGLPGLRFLHPRLTSLWAALDKANADLYYQRAAGALTGFVVAFAIRRRKVAIYAGAHDQDFDPLVPLVRYARDRALFRWGLRHASAVVTQSQAQAGAFRRQFGRDSDLIRSCHASSGPHAKHDGVVLWAATVKPEKQPELFVELARRCPEYRFRMVGGGQDDHWRSIRSLASNLTNLELTGFVPFADVHRHFDDASIFVNTSKGEGFPNTFLQSWSRGIPTLSFFDPNAEWKGRPVSLTVDSLDFMVDKLRALKEHYANWHAAGTLSIEYVTAFHSVDSAVEGYERLFSRLRLRGIERP